MGLLWFVIIGAIAGWLAGQFMRGHGFGLLGDIIVGVIGAFIGRDISTMAGLGLAAYALGYWGAQRFGPLPVTETMRFVIPSTTAFLLGFQLLHGAFFFSVLEIRASQSNQATKPGPRA